jgi:hypothetical protein
MAEKEFEELEAEVVEELAAVIGDFADDKKGSTVRDIQPTEPVIRAMAQAAAAVLIAFEHGYRLGG